MGEPGRWATVAVAVIGATACGEAAPRTVSTVDSAGVEIVTNQPGAMEALASWELSAEPMVEIGAGASPEVPLHRVRAVTPLEGGGVAVAAESPPQALVFGADGALKATLGREGGGPGEFMRVSSVVPAGDSVAVWDPDRRRISVFTRGGRFVREADLSELAPMGVMAAPNTSTPAAFTHLLPAPDGGFLLFSVGAFGPETGVRRPASPSYRLSRAGGVLDTLGPFPGYESYSSERTGVLPYPFGANTYGVISGDGLVVGTAESPELRYHGVGGALVRIVRWPGGDRAVEGPLVEQWETSLAVWLEEMPPGQREMMRDLFDRIPRPDSLPAYDGVIAGADGRVWVGEYVGVLSIPATPIDRRVPPRRWLVFDPAGVVTATVETPPGFQPHAVSGTRVWGVFRDELDVESVRAYGIIRP